MLYAHFTLSNPSDRTVGEQLSDGLDNYDFTVLQPTVTDWGYLFTVTIRRQVFDVALKYLGNNEYGLEIKALPDLVGLPVVRNPQSILEELQGGVDDVLTDIEPEAEATWYSFSEWKKTFGKSFWDE